MNLWILITSLAIAPFIYFSAAQAEPSEGVTLQPEILFSGHPLLLNGSGDRSKFFTNVYVASLYLTQTSSDANHIINQDQPQLMRLNITSSLITKNRLMSSIKEGLKLSAGSEYSKYAAMLDAVFNAQAIEVNDGDQFDFFYVPGEGTRISFNNEEIKTVPGLDFKQVLFGIWIGKKPVQADLKQKLLKGATGARSRAKQPDMA